MAPKKKKSDTRMKMKLEVLKKKNKLTPAELNMINDQSDDFASMIADLSTREVYEMCWYGLSAMKDATLADLYKDQAELEGN